MSIWPKIELSSIPLRFWGLGLLFLFFIACLGFGPTQSDFGWIAGLHGGAFLLYLAIYREVDSHRGLFFFLGVAVLARILLVGAFPQLSDDIYRFIWDGRLINHGINPFGRLPAYYMQEGHEIPGLSPELFSELNSQKYFTIYPPVAQATFAAATWLFPDSLVGASVVMKLFLLSLEAGSLILLLKLLSRLGFPEKGALLYALNPMILIEVMGNLHFEGAMAFFLLLSLWWMINGRYLLSAGALAFSVAAKLLPLLFCFFLIRRLGWRRSISFFAVMGLVLLLLFSPLLGGAFFSGMGSSLRLYFQRFEFNGSVYYLLRWVGYQLSGYNLIKYFGPALAACTFLGIGLAALIERRRDWRSLPEMMLFAICLYLAFTPTVHPWYASLPLVLAPFTRYRFPVLWTALISLTYINYSTPEYHEYLGVVALEYIAVYSVAAWEWKSGKNWLEALI
ncbi:MAG: hypothetical protein KDD06_13560 [Phaeodactylibacter sp.]|nr:hypothetical protein [Phaeodactylibacter sp.]MCB9265106.1 hypothetical protein [Lewinellaceae bacterium]MCB9287362.1 hypothetical protein [Lewinellaceae bacterium]